MIKEREHVIAKASLIFQTALTVLSYLAACGLYHSPHARDVWQSKDCLFFAVLIVPVWWLLFEYTGFGQMSRDERYRHLFVNYLKVVTAGNLLLYTATLFLLPHWINLNVLLLFGLINQLVLFGAKLFFFRLMKFVRRKGYNSRQVLVIGDDASVDYVRTLLLTKDWGYRVWGILATGKKLKHTFAGQVMVYPGDTRVSSLLGSTVIDEIFYCKGEPDYAEVNKLVGLCAELGVVFRMKPVDVQTAAMKSKFTYLHKTPQYVFRNIPENYLALKVKRAFDMVFSLLVLILLSPVFLFIAVAIWLDDNGPVFFQQERVGLNGRRFTCFKFRTMVVNAESLKSELMAQNEQSGPVFKIKFDPRITRVGRVLRRTSLDELPQFFNVLFGEMSVVGPRPPLPSEVNQYQRWQNRRLSMKPGITCIWQVSGRNNIGFEEWVRLDTQYIDQWSLRLDMIIILKTIRVIFTGDGQ